jgi:hypothetical protein
MVRENGGWRYPFLVAHTIITEHDLEPIEARLAREVGRAARDLSAAITADARLDQIEDAMRLQAIALTAWGQTTLALRQSSEVLGGISLPRRKAIVIPHPRYLD